MDQERKKKITMIKKILKNNKGYRKRGEESRSRIGKNQQEWRVLE
jgi:hypothetical protein